MESLSLRLSNGILVEVQVPGVGERRGPGSSTKWAPSTIFRPHLQNRLLPQLSQFSHRPRSISPVVIRISSISFVGVRPDFCFGVLRFDEVGDGKLASASESFGIVGISFDFCFGVLRLDEVGDDKLAFVSESFGNLAFHRSFCLEVLFLPIFLTASAPEPSHFARSDGKPPNGALLPPRPATASGCTNRARCPCPPDTP